MKTTTISIIVILILTSFLSFGQNPSMTISHAGISPNTSLTVSAGDSIDFIYGGGGTHPMTEGWQTGETSTPINFVTRTVSSSVLSLTFVMGIPGTYYFHCGSNPTNSANWGKIIVLDSTSTGIPEVQMVHYAIYPNPATDILTIEGLKNTGEIYNLIGKKVMDINSPTINVKALPKGKYIVKVGNYSSVFIKK
ncbi:T9SS type A sorting domain-containing protein [Flavobacteriales bacterium]|nr:T9SS type A sorting domain-containing protein [Flavobacteriales bacterium]